MNIGDLFWSLRANDARLQTDVKKAGDKAGTTLGQSMSASLKKAFSGQEFGKGLVQGLGFAGALGAANLAATAISKVTDFIGSSIEAASNLNETLFKSEKVFEDHADEMEAWAATGATAFGLSKRAALDAAAGFAGLFKTAGIGIDEASEKARTLTELAADLASTFNTEVADAAEAIRSGLAGESEPLRRFNVFLSETAVTAKLVEMGQKKVNGQWTEAQKQLGRYLLIMEQTIDAQGVFGADADSLTDKQRMVNAQLENTQAILGEKLLPIQLAVTQAQLDFVEGLALVADPLRAFAEGVGDTANDLTTVLDILSFWDEQTHFFSDDAMGHVQGALRKTGKESNDLRADVFNDGADIRKSLNKTADTADNTSDETVKAMEAIEEALDDVRDAAYDTVEAFGDQAYSADELRGRLAELERSLFDAKEELRRLEAIKDPTAEQRQDIIITRGEVAGYRHDIFNTRIDLAKLDATTLAGLLQELAKAQYRTDLLGDEAREALTLFQKLAFASKNVPGYSGGDPGYAPRAEGGPVEAMTPYWVGEKGRPELFVPRSDGTIYTEQQVGNMGWSGGGGNTYEYHIHAEGQLKVEDPLAAANLLARFQGSGMLPEGGDD